MTLLLDTHVLLWVSEDSPELPRAVGETIDDAAQDDGVLVSPWSFWEVAQLVSKRRIELLLGFDAVRRNQLFCTNIQLILNLFFYYLFLQLAY